MEIFQDPLITMTERTGYPGGVPDDPICPVCGMECETVYRGSDGQIFGCNFCVTEDDAWETPECYGGRREA